MESSEIGRPRALRRSNPAISGQQYQYRQPQYDVYMVAPATQLTKQVLFQITQGQQYTPAGGGAFFKTQWHTSMVQAGLFPNPDVFYAKQISVDFRGDIYIADAQHLLWDSLITFNISQRPFLQLAATKLPGAGGLFGFVGTNFTNGLPTQDNEFDFSDTQGEVIEQGQNFNVVVDPTLVIDSTGLGVYTSQSDQGEAGGTGINAKVTLDGLYSRIVL